MKIPQQQNSWSESKKQDNKIESSESEWENPFAMKRGGSQESCFHLNEDEELPYPKFKREVLHLHSNALLLPGAQFDALGLRFFSPFFLIL
ncbi:hypothetical protein Tco_0234235, partial [Tanacetum coccineum]